MDKNLKKLSRVELLELMISLSEDYEALADENNRLKKMLSVQRLPRSTKVGSIAEAALAANGYFEAAQRSADEYLREIKHLKDELAKRAEAQSPAAMGAQAYAAQQAGRQAQVDIQQAQQQASHIVARANAQADAIIADARARAEETLANANRQSHAILSQAQRQLSQVPRVSQVPTTQGSPMTQGPSIASMHAQVPQVQHPYLAPDATVELPNARGRHTRPIVGGGF